MKTTEDRRKTKLPNKGDGNVPSGEATTREVEEVQPLETASNPEIIKSTMVTSKNTDLKKIEEVQPLETASNPEIIKSTMVTSKNTDLKKTASPIVSQDEKKASRFNKNPMLLPTKKRAKVEGNPEPNDDSILEVYDKPLTNPSKNITVQDTPVHFNNFKARHMFETRLSSLGHSYILKDFVRLCFGLEKDEITKGLEISDQRENQIINYILNKCRINLNRKNIAELNDEKRQALLYTPFFQILVQEKSYELTITIGDILRVVGDEGNGWLTDQVLVLLQDVINLFLTESVENREYPPCFFANGLTMDALCKLAVLPAKVKHGGINYENKKFNKMFIERIQKNELRTPLANILEKYHNAGKELEYIYSYLNLKTEHYIGLIIDMKQKVVITIDPYHVKAKTEFITARKWIAKIFGVLSYLVKNEVDTENEIYFGNKDMLNDHFTKEEEDKLSDEVKAKAKMFYHLDFFETTKSADYIDKNSFKFPKQRDGVNCGVYSFWYGVMHLYQGQKVTPLNPKRFRKQLLFFIIGLDLFYSKIKEQPRFTFPSNHTTLPTLMHKYGSDVLKDICAGIMSDNLKEDSGEDEEIFPTQIVRTKNIAQWCLSVKSLMEKQSYYFKTELLKVLLDPGKQKEDDEDMDTLLLNTLGKNDHTVHQPFGKQIRELSRTPSVDIKLVFYWNFSKRKILQNKLFNVMKECFVKTVDDKGIYHTITKPGDTYALTIQMKDPFQEEATILAFCIFSLVYNNKSPQQKKPTLFCAIVDYFGTIPSASKFVLPSFQHELFTGKGLGRFLLNMTQIFCFINSDQENYPVLLKCNDDAKSYYEELGFIEPSEAYDPFKHEEVIKHFEAIPDLSPDLHKFVLRESTRIDHHKKSFINRVYYDYKELILSGDIIDKHLVSKIHDFFHSKAFINLLDQSNRVKNQQNHAFVIPIGEIILHFYQQYKPTELKKEKNIYELVLQKLIWELDIKTYARKMNERPSCSVDLLCDQCCGYIERDFYTMFLDRYNVCASTSDDQGMRKRVKHILDETFGCHFCINNFNDEDADSDSKCKKFTNDFMCKLKNARDRTLYMIGNDRSKFGNRYVDEKLFKILMRLFLQCHLQCHEIVDYFPWKQQTPVKAYENAQKKRKRPLKRLRVANMVDRRQKVKEEVGKILGENEKKLRKQYKQQNLEKVQLFRRKKQVKDWSAFWDDIFFLKSLGYVGYYDKKHDSFRNDVRAKVVNIDALEENESKYFVGFPDKDKEGQGSIRLLSSEWIDEHLSNQFVESLKKSKNQKKPLPLATKRAIHKDIKKLSEHNVTHVHKYKCKTTFKTLYCNALPRPNGYGKGKGFSTNFEIMYNDQITEEWLYQTVVGLNGNHEWYDKIMDPSLCNHTFELPVASVITGEIKPMEEAHAPIVRYPQEGEGTCGISALSSAFAFNFDVQLGTKLIAEKENYKSCLCQPVIGKSKTSASMKFLIGLMFKKPFSRLFVVKKLKQTSWKTLQSKSGLFYSVILCLPKSTILSRDHIFAVSQGWIFDGNLSYAVGLTMENLNWSTGHGKEDINFSGFHEMYQIELKKKSL